MSKYNGYTKAGKEAALRYRAKAREQLNINLAKGTKEVWKAQAERKGFKSLTEYITFLIENDN